MHLLLLSYFILVKMADTKTLEARCRCRAVHFTVTLPLSALPLPIHLCHCSMCRYRSGAPCVFHTHIDKQWPVEFIAPSVEENITQYDIPGAKSLWHFCSTCGCHVGSRLRTDGSWVISTSIFSDHGTENFMIRKHIHSKSTKDGGLAACMENSLSGQRSGAQGEETIEDWNPDNEVAKVIEPETDNKGQERLRAQCHCGGVSFTIGRPTAEHLTDSFHQRYVSPLDKSKWLATYDVCNDCRLVDGTHVVGWTFVPVSSIDLPIKRDLAVGTSKTYASSPGVLRSFCGTCGATIFFSCEERRPTEDTQVLDVATGILRAPEGVMATEWLTWRPRVAHAHSGKSYDQNFWLALTEGMNSWADKQYRREHGENFVNALNRSI